MSSSNAVELGSRSTDPDCSITSCCYKVRSHTLPRETGTDNTILILSPALSEQIKLYLTPKILNFSILFIDFKMLKCISNFGMEVVAFCVQVLVPVPLIVAICIPGNIHIICTFAVQY